MRSLLVLLALAAAAFWAGRAIADEKAKSSAKPPAKEAVALLIKRQAKLYEDIKKIENAAVDWIDIQEQRAEGKFELNRFERKMEKDG